MVFGICDIGKWSQYWAVITALSFQGFVTAGRLRTSSFLSVGILDMTNWIEPPEFG